MSRLTPRPTQRTAAALLTGTVLSGLCLAGTLASPAAAAQVVHQSQVTSADRLTVSPASAGWMFSSTGNRTQDSPVQALGLWRDGTAGMDLDVPAALAGTAGARLSVTAGADRCNGGADMTVSIDGAQVARRSVDADWGVYPVAGRLAAGPHTVTIGYTGDVVTATCDRSLKLYAVTTYAERAAPEKSVTFGPPSLQLSSPTAGLWHDLAGGTAETVLWSNADVSRRFTFQDRADAQVVVTAGGDDCGGQAEFETSLDGVSLGRTLVTGRPGTFASYPLAVGALAPGAHELRVAFVNDVRTDACDRNLHLRSVTVRG